MGEKKLEVIIRDYCEADLDQMLALVRELEADLTEKFKDVQIKPENENYQNRYLKPGTKYKTLVAEVEGKVIGYLMGYPSLGAPEVDQMYDILPLSSPWRPPEFYLQITFVSKPYRNKGVSTALHREIISYARRQGYKEVFACIAKWNLPELTVIESCGFERKDLGYRYRLSLKL